MNPSLSSKSSFRIDGSIENLTILQRVVIAVSLGAACLLVAVLIFNRVTIRFDLSFGRFYSLSSASKDLIQRLPDNLVIKTYFSKNFPPLMANLATYTEDLLREYEIRSKGKIKFSKADNRDSQKLRQEASRAGVPPIQIQNIERDQYQVLEANMGIVFLYQDKKEVIEIVTQMEGLEYEITSRIKKLVQEEKRVLAWTSGHGEFNPSSFPELEKYFKEQYDLRTVSLETSTSIPHEVDALIVYGPTNPFEEASRKAVEEAFNRGTSVALFLDTHRVDLSNFYATPIDNGLDSWLKSFGIKLRKGLVFDLFNQPVTMTSRQGIFNVRNIVQYPPFIKVVKLDRAHAATKDLESVVFPFAGALVVDTATLSGFTTTVLAESSPRSWFVERIYTLHPYQIQPTPQGPAERGPFSLAVVLQDKDSAKRLLVVGTSQFARPGSPVPATSTTFFLNLIDWLAQDSDLISIRAKGAVNKPLKNIPPAVRDMVKWGSFLGWPILAAGVGFVRWRKRRQSKMRKAQEYVG